jgi:hypothetical protein
MILQFSEHEYVDVSKIAALRWLEVANKGVVVFDGERIMLNNKDFDIVETAYRWFHKSHMYDEGMRKIKLVRREGE